MTEQEQRIFDIIQKHMHIHNNIDRDIEAAVKEIAQQYAYINDIKEIRMRVFALEVSIKSDAERINNLMQKVKGVENMWLENNKSGKMSKCEKCRRFNCICKNEEVKKTCPNCGKEHGSKDNNYCTSCIDKLAKMRMDTYIDDDGRFARYRNINWRCPECDTENADDVALCECGYSKSRRK